MSDYLSSLGLSLIHIFQQGSRSVAEAEGAENILKLYSGNKGGIEKIPGQHDHCLLYTSHSVLECMAGREQKGIILTQINIMINPDQLSPEQVRSIRDWAEKGLDLNAIQKRLHEDMGIKLTFMDTRFLLQDLSLINI